MIWEIGWSLIEHCASKGSASRVACRETAQANKPGERAQCSVLPCSSHPREYFAFPRRQPKAWGSQEGWVGIPRYAAEGDIDIAAGLKESTGLSVGRGF